MWEQGLTKALTQAENLQNAGWTVDFNQGALTKKQFSKVASKLEREGFEVKEIPVAHWDKEQIKLIAYKPKPGVPENPPMPTPEKKTETVKPNLSAVLFDRFNKIWKGSDVEDGFAMNPEKTACIVNHGASGSSNYSSLVKTIGTVVKEAPNQGTVKKIDYATKFHKRLLKAERRGFKNVQIGDQSFSIENLKKVMRILSGQRNFKVYVKNIAVFMSQQGDMLTLAPVVTTTPAENVEFNDVNKFLPK